MYRMSSDLAPYATHPDMPQFHDMVAESDAELRAIGAKAKAARHATVIPPVAVRPAQQPRSRADGKSIWDLSVAGRDAGPHGARARGRGGDPRRRALRRS